MSEYIERQSIVDLEGTTRLDLATNFTTTCHEMQSVYPFVERFNALNEPCVEIEIGVVPTAVCFPVCSGPLAVSDIVLCVTVADAPRLIVSMNDLRGSP